MKHPARVSLEGPQQRKACRSQRSIQQAQEAMHLEQRAWVFVTETRASKLQVGQPLNITIGFKNTGRTPARNVQIALRYRF